MTAPLPRSRLAWLLVVGHGVGVLLVIVATWLYFGTTGSLSIPNQVPWTSIIWAQMALLALYLCMGRQHFALRLVGFVAGISVTIGCTLFAWYLLTGPPPKLAKWLATWFFQEAMLSVPEGMCVAALIMLARPIFGTISGDFDDHRSGQFALRDLLGSMTLSAVVLGLLRFTFALGFADFTHDFQYFPLLVGSRAAGFVGAAILLLAGSRRWIGLPLLALALASECFVWPPQNIVDWLSMAYGWSVVLVTLAALRYVGYRLHGGMLSGRGFGVLEGGEAPSEPLSKESP